jgi:murein L,D-transpeptidase YafK
LNGKSEGGLLKRKAIASFLAFITGVIFALASCQLAASALENQQTSAAESEPVPALAKDYTKRGLKPGAPVFLRIYKQQAVIELWVSQGARYKLFKAYPICKYSGGLGPKLEEGDRQAPEGVYYIRASDLIVNQRWHRAMDLNFPNAFDLANGRTGSGIFIHGKCSSIGCFALKDADVEELYEAVATALEAGQVRVPVLSLPFPMTGANLKNAGMPENSEFWLSLKRASDMFNRDRLPPSALLCGTRYGFASRRGGRGRRYVPQKDCQPLSRPVPAVILAAAGTAKPKRPPLIAVVDGLSPKEAAERQAKSCNPRETRCRLLRIALTSPVICPKKYARCRTAEAALTKSVDCPLKYPRCRGRAASRRRV